jgi:hypothetical protein
MWLLAQTSKTVQDFDFWADRGILGVVVLAFGLAIYFAIKEVWNVVAPHISDWLKNQAEVPKKQSAFIDHVTYTHSEQIEINRRQAASMEALAATVGESRRAQRALGYIAEAGKAASENPEVHRHLDRAIDALE